MSPFKRKTSLDLKIETLKEMIEKWSRLMLLYKRYRDSDYIKINDENESMKILAWLQQNYLSTVGDLKGVVRKEFVDRIRGIRVKDYDEILNLIGHVGSLSEMVDYRFRDELEDFLRGGRNRLNMYLGHLENKKKLMGVINIDEYETLKEFYENKIKEKERLSERENLAKNLTIKTKMFKIADEYFEEAKSCFIYGVLKGSVILAISALESCIKTDYFRIKGEDYKGKFYTLLNRYFSGDIKRLPKQYEEFSKTYVKIRNSLAHPEEFEFSETIVFTVLSTIAELVNHVEKLPTS